MGGGEASSGERLRLDKLSTANRLCGLGLDILQPAAWVTCARRRNNREQRDCNALHPVGPRRDYPQPPFASPPAKATSAPSGEPSFTRIIVKRRDLSAMK